MKAQPPRSLITRLTRAITGRAEPSVEEVLRAAEAEVVSGRPQRAFAAIRGLAMTGNASAQFRLGQFYERAEGVVQSLPDAAHWYRMAADQGHTGAQSRLGLIYFIEPPPSAGLTGETSQQAGDISTQTTLARLFPHGFDIRQDYAEAFKWNRLAADAGMAEAQARLGRHYAEGLGVEKSHEQAERWFVAAAQQGDVAGQLGLGVLCAGGYGAAPDYDRALEWFRRAAEAGNAAAQFSLAVLLKAGEQPPRIPS